MGKRHDTGNAYSTGRLHIMLQTVVILAGMAALFGLIGGMLFGLAGLVVAFILVLVIFLSTPKLSPWMVLRMYRARSLSLYEAPGLHEIVRELSRRAGLPVVPLLCYIPSSVMNAFSVGSSSSSAIALSDGILRFLSLRELSGVLAHEISHIRNNDLKLHALADIMTRITSLFSFLGQMLIVIYLPLALFSQADIPLVPILLLIFAPSLSMLLQFALSRTREFDADLGAARLTGDPAGLASALNKMDRYDRSIWDMVLFPGRKLPQPSLLRSHPHTKERLEKLMNLAADQGSPFMDMEGKGGLSRQVPQVERKPGWNWFRPWH
ncbi:MAG: zinc metalloprotease HtpX [Deltaproteobacteria bacterium]|nr:zinc metalloprotease HtpX [Deltaproteobacteria bacterium]